VGDREGIVAMRGGEVEEVRVGSKANVDVCLGCQCWVSRIAA